MSKKTWTKESAIARMIEKGIGINHEKKQLFVDPRPGIGNGTLGAVDYLRKKHKYVVVFGKEGK